MFRKRRQPAAHFRIPGSPYNPATGQHSPLKRYATPATLLSIFQVIGDDPADESTEDTHENYIVCRGYEPQADPLFRFLHDPHTSQNTEPINVAKPFAARGSFTYRQGHIIVAARIQTKLGFTSGAASESVGHPEDLDEEIEILLDDEDVAISWLDLGPAPKRQSDVRFYNDCGATYPAFGISRVTDRTPASGGQPETLTVAKVDATYRWHYFVNGPKDIANGEYGYGSYLIDCDGEALVDTGTSPACGERYGPKVDSFVLGENRPGFHVTGGLAGSGGQTRVGVRQFPPGEVRVKHDDGGATFASGAGPRTFGIYGGPSLETDTGLEVTLVANLSSTSWTTGKYGMASLDMGRIGGLPTEKT